MVQTNEKPAGTPCATMRSPRSVRFRVKPHDCTKRPGKSQRSFAARGRRSPPVMNFCAVARPQFPILSGDCVSWGERAGLQRMMLHCPSPADWSSANRRVAADAQARQPCDTLWRIGDVFALWGRKLEPRRRRDHRERHRVFLIGFPLRPLRLGGEFRPQSECARKSGTPWQTGSECAIVPCVLRAALRGPFAGWKQYQLTALFCFCNWKRWPGAAAREPAGLGG